MKTASFVLAGLVATSSFLACSSDKPVGQLTLVLQTDLAVPKDLDWIRIEVRTDGQPLGTDSPPPLHRSDYVLDPNQPPDVRVTVPATFAVFDKKGQAEPVAIRVSAGRAGEARVLRDTFTTVPSERNAMLRVYLQWLALGSAQPAPPGADPHAATNACPPGQTNVAGSCVDAHVAVESLPDFDAKLVFGAPTPAEGNAFDVASCFAAAQVATPDPTTCTIAAPSAPAANINVGLAIGAGSDGFCDAQRCIVPLDRQEDATSPQVGWKAAGTRIQLPPGVCTHAPPPLVLVATECPTKTAATATCGPDSSVTTCTVKGTQTAPPPPPGGGDLADVQWSLGAGHMCMVHTSSGAAWCWGDNGRGQAAAAPGPDVGFTTAARPLGTARVTAIAAGYDSTCAIVGTAIQCWGNNRYGQLGTAATGTDSSVGPQNVTLPSPETPATIAVSRGDARAHACAVGISKQTIWCWGDASADQLGVAPGAGGIAQLTIAEGIEQMALGGTFTCILRGDRKIECWGNDSDGQLGDGQAGSKRLRNQTTVTLPGSGSATAISAGYASACAIVDGSVYCWGLNASGQVTGVVGGTAMPPTPVAMVRPNVTFVAAGDFFACAAQPGVAGVDCWGDNSSLQLASATGGGPGKTNPALTIDTPVTGLHAGGEFACIESATSALCWGANGHRQVDDSAPSTSLPPTSIHPP